MRGFPVLFAIAAVLLIPFGYYVEWVYPTKSIEAELADAGITDVKLEWKMFSGTIFTRCNHEHATVRSFTGIKNERYVSGTACYAPFWGATHWED